MFGPPSKFVVCAPTLGRLIALSALISLSACAAAPPRTSGSTPAPAASALADVASFDAILERGARARALFLEAHRVLSHPRCVGCHPSDDAPRQGDTLAVHDPPVVRGPADLGAPALECVSCHQDRNLEAARIPGAPNWHLAPKSMAWLDRSAAQICAQLKDPTRNGGRTLAQVLDHVAHDPLVGWGWSPGHGRTPAPGTQAQFAALVAAWIDAGADCPLAEHE